MHSCPLCTEEAIRERCPAFDLQNEEESVSTEAPTRKEPTKDVDRLERREIRPDRP
jgi:hypothetical protein